MEGTTCTVFSLLRPSVAGGGILTTVQRPPTPSSGEVALKPGLAVADAPREILNLGVGDIVVYGAHGAGSVAARETRSVHGREQKVVVIALAGGLSVQLPLALAQEHLRPTVDEAGIAIIQEVLRAPAESSKDSWLKRRRDSEAKLREAIGLAEILRDANARDTAPERGAGSHLSPGERELVGRARRLLTNEIALARGVSLEEAEAWLDAQLAG
jgi:CarD family transcriptional regulator